MHFLDHHEEVVIVAAEDLSHHLQAEEQGGEAGFSAVYRAQVEKGVEGQEADAGGQGDADPNENENQSESAGLKPPILERIAALMEDR
jgi:hypothetical protein